MRDRSYKKTCLLIVLIVISAWIIGYAAVHRNRPSASAAGAAAVPSLDIHANPAFIQAKGFHAAGNGKTDDTDNVQRAVRAAAAVNGTVYFGKGTYVVSHPIDIPENVSIIGAGKEQTTFRSVNKNTDPVFSLGGNQTVQDVGFDSQIGIIPLGDNININECRFKSSVQGIQNAVTVRNLTVTDTLFEGCGYSILSNKQPSYHVKIINCRFLNNKADDIEINAPSDGWTIENCVFSGITSHTSNAGFGVGIALSARNITIKGSTFSGIAGQGIHAEDHAQVTVSNCTFQNNGYVHYPGSPEADIAVLSNADVSVFNCVFLKSTKEYSSLAIYNTDIPVGGTVTAQSSAFYGKKIDAQVQSMDNRFLK